MAAITTARILSDKALQVPCGQQCIDWAILKLDAGHEGHYLAMLAGLLPPFNHFEVADLRDRALREVGAPEVPGTEAVLQYSVESFRSALEDNADLIETLEVVKDLCIACDNLDDLFDFYLLYFAYTDLQNSELQWYWPGATQENILDVIRQRAERFVRNARGAV